MTSCNSVRMAFSDKMRPILAVILMLFLSTRAFGGNLKFDEPKVGPKGNVLFTYVLDDLPLSADEAFAASLNYIQNEYRTTKYNDIECVADMGIVYGKGNLNSFYTDNGLVKSEVFSADYYLRLDAKDGKVRVQLIFTNYNVQKLSDTSDREVVDVVISKVAPFADAENNGRYRKVFKALAENADVVLNSVVDRLRSISPAPVLDEW